MLQKHHWINRLLCGIDKVCQRKKICRDRLSSGENHVRMFLLQLAHESAPPPKSPTSTPKPCFCMPESSVHRLYFYTTMGQIEFMHFWLSPLSFQGTFQLKTTFFNKGKKNQMWFSGPDSAVKVRLAFQLLMKLCADVGETKDILLWSMLVMTFPKGPIWFLWIKECLAELLMMHSIFKSVRLCSTRCSSSLGAVINTNLSSLIWL